MAVLCLQIINATTAQWQWHRNAVNFRRPYLAKFEAAAPHPTPAVLILALHTKSLDCLLKTFSDLVTAAKQPLPPRLVTYCVAM